MAINTKGRILLIFPACLPWFQESNEIGAPIEVESHELPMTPPLGILYIAAALLNAGFDVEFVDFEGEDYSPERMISLVENKNAVGISVATLARPMVAQIVRDIRSVRPEIPIVLGGPDITLCKQLTEGADVAVIGDATDRVAEVFSKVLAHEDLSGCPGLLYRSAPGGPVCKSEGAIPPENLETLPPAAFHLVNPEAYAISETRRGKRRLLGVPLMTARGCPFHCAFCCCWQLTENYYQRTAASVLDELEGLARAGYEVVFILDDTFTANRKRAEAILDGIAARGLRLIFIMYVRTDTIDEALCRKMRRAGVRLCLFGLESGTQEVLDFYRKRTHVEQNRRAIQLANRSGLYCLGFFMMGAPMETEEQIRRTIRFAESLPLESAIFRPLYYASPTPLWCDAEEKGLIGPEELVCISDSNRGLGKLSAASYIQISLDATRAFQRKPSRFLRLAFKILWWRDWTFARRFYRVKRASRLTRQVSFGVSTPSSQLMEKAS